YGHQISQPRALCVATLTSALARSSPVCLLYFALKCKHHCCLPIYFSKLQQFIINFMLSATHTQTYSNILTHTHTHTYSHTQTHTCTRTHTHTHTQTHTCTRTHTDTHTHTHAHTHTHSLFLLLNVSISFSLFFRRPPSCS